MSEVAGYYARNTTGIVSGYPYHSDRDCRGLEKSSDENLIEVSRDEVDRHGLRECNLCQREKTREVMEKLGVRPE